ncbi:hypothetical protein Btru_056612 [Bulinus truncatus]|nr:hypothetical protein Btru_056612 [Bulinus truncatus]
MPGDLVLEKNGDDEVSLFSLELVIEKVYIPHSPCRFPAIAFRLLDFPTIVIKHVEDDLAKAIRHKISFDPYYNLPEQFTELKDKHGNFMVKKGKSCLFKMSANVLKQHLSSTPLYVMVIDLFPEVPKLIGNSSIPLNSLIESICVDIIKLGPTVPSVHGDKGLFKIYNLMGKEIGYFVLGFRLLCLGHSLIPHIPESSLVHQDTNLEVRKLDQLISNITELQEEKVETTAPQILHKNSSSMTEPLREIIDRSDKEVLVNIDGFSPNHACSASTQTERKSKVIKKQQKTVSKWIRNAEVTKDDHDIIVNNIICPPPMFYNSEASPALQVSIKNPLTQFDENLSVNELSDIDSFDGFGLHSKKLQKSEISKQERLKPAERHILPEVKDSEWYIPQARKGELVKGLPVAPQPESVFPLLTALIKELSCIQNPQLLLDISNKLQTVPLKTHEKQPTMVAIPEVQENEKLPLSVVSAVATALTKKLESSKPVFEKDLSAKQQSIQQQINIKAEQRGDTKKSNAVKMMKMNHTGIKGKLIFGLTHTQRLRLQKTNPNWLKLVEKEASELKIKSHPVKKTSELDDINATSFSDTLTEVRRLAEKELNTPVAFGDTLLNLESDVEFGTSTVDSINAHKKVCKKSSKIHELHKKSKLASKARQEKNFRSSQTKSQAYSHQKDKSIKMSSMTKENENKEAVTKSDDDGQFSARSDALSSRSRSIEVRLPSADPEPFNNISGAENDSSSDSDEDIPLPDDSVRDLHKNTSSIINFSKYLSRSSSPPEPILGNANASLNISTALDDNSPLESTRHSKSVVSDKNDSRIFQSTDYDTHQFVSTDEPELQGLMSEEVNMSETADSGGKSVTLVRTSQKFPIINPQLSESSPVPSVRRSHNKIDLGNLSHLTSGSPPKDLYSPPSSRAISLKGTQEKKPESYRLSSQQDNKMATPKLTITPRSVSSSPRHPKPPPRKALRESIHTDSISSYMPSDPDNVIVSLSTSNSGNYTDDFLQSQSGNSLASSNEQLPKIISSAKLGYTIS